MDTVIRLGEQIELYGFEAVDRGALVILRKVIGNAARTLAEKYPKFQKLVVHLEGAGLLLITVELADNDQTKTASAEGTNLFFTLDKALKQL